ncbi:hypothetical protein [Nocardia aurantia]|uniref:Uncharacterized protein n=1 Tax=Nocardia aurantia TaxID=2585199 RepID=A0A7K0DVV3_9NOCA|nr:hypothetical protein [Nocardia aurantia]MQY29911.1 hypothetical protein [Nocardia aurantia]
MIGTRALGRLYPLSAGWFAGGRCAVVVSAIVWLVFSTGCALRLPIPVAAGSAVALRGSVAAGPPERSFVFRSGTEVVLATRDRVVARHPGHYADAGFTRDNSHIYALDATGTVRAVEARGGAMLPGSIDCRCDRVFPLHGTTVGWWRPPGDFLQADLHEPNPVVRVTISLPAPPDPIAAGNLLGAVRLLAADDRTLVLAETESPPGASWGLTHLFSADPETGAVRPLGRVDGVNTAIDRVALHPSGGELAVPGYQRDGKTCGAARLLWMELPGPRPERLDLPPDTGCSVLIDVRWDAGELTVARLQWQPGTPDRPSAAMVWSRRGAGWERRGGDDVLRHLALTPSATVQLRRGDRDRVHTEHAGELVLAADDEIRVLAHDVLDVRVPYP